MSAVAIFNPNSGSAGDEDTLAAWFAGGRVRLVPTTEDDPGIGQAAAAVADGVATVIACGGDGTVRAVLQSVAGTRSALGVVPLGTGNLLAANLGLRTDADAATDAVHGPLRRLDVGVANEERFAVMAGVGFDALMIRDANPTVKKRLGSTAYVVSALRNLPGRLFRAEIDVDGGRVWAGRTVMVLVGNCSTVSGGIEVFPDAQPDDGRLDIAVIQASNWREWLSVGWRMLRRTAQRPDLVQRFTGSEVAVRLPRARPWELDGEDRDPTAGLLFEIEPQALQVHVPA